MLKKTFTFPAPFANTAKKSNVEIVPVSEKNFKAWAGRQGKATQVYLKNNGFGGKSGESAVLCDKNGVPQQIVLGVGAPVLAYDFAHAVTAARKLSGDFVNKSSFSIAPGLSKDELERACIAWALACYKFDTYKKNGAADPQLVWPKGVDRKRVQAFTEGISLIRSLINTPANDMGPDELGEAARTLAKSYKASIKVTADKKLLTDNFPMIYAVGKASTRRPRLIDMSWGNPKHPKLTIVGKGVCFDTGGLDIKPSASMLLMKKDMGGAAHALGLALAVMKLGIKVRLRVLIPAVENSISGNAFRPSDILQSRKGKTVEVGNTDAEGRLVLGDALTLACEEKPDLLIDFATLTGAARVALGTELPAVFSNREQLAEDIKKAGMAAEDPVWPLPLWKGYLKDMQSPVADINSTGSGQGGAIIAALFLHAFIDDKIDWAHFDIFAWENAGKPGRPRGGADTGMRAALKLIEKKFG
jgi:leucyl aminopeptidase